MRTMPAVQQKRIPYSVAFEIMQRRSEAASNVAAHANAIERLAFLASGDPELEVLIQSLRDLQSACVVSA